MRRLLALAAALALVSACASGNDHPPPVEGGVIQDDGGPIVGACTSSAEQGCPCGDAGVGATAECVATRYGANGYKSCGPGTRACGSDGKWGVCVGASAWDAGGP
jgi:hypothetical protein